MIQVSNLSKSYGQQVVFDDVSWTLQQGERVGLVGRNGHGKTTLFRLITGEEQPDAGVISIPSGYRVGHLSQHLHFSAGTVLQEACLGLRQNDDGRDESYRVKTILSGLGFSADDFDRSPTEISGGYQIRLNLAKILVNQPELLLLDEPTNYLDILAIRWLAGFLRGWKNELILITHDRDFMDRVSTHTMAIHRKKIRKIAGPTSKMYEQIALEEEVYEKTRLNDEKRRGEIERFINRFRAQANKARAVQSRIKALEKKERLDRLTAEKTLDFEFRNAPFTGKRLLEVEGLAFSFDRKEPFLLEGLSFSVGKNERIAVIGKNGRGKTTLLNLLAGEMAPVKGSIVRHPDLRIAYFGQTNIDRLSPGKTVEEEIMDAQPEQSRNAARNICGAMMFEGDLATKKIGVLSGGERSRVLLGKLLVASSNLLILDEPTNHLDMESVASLVEAIDSFDGAVIIVTHSEMILNAVAERLIVFDGERPFLFEGAYADFLERVGWKSEEEEVNPSVAPQPADRKNMRRLRAGIIDSRSQVIGRIQKRMTEVERTIISLEEEVERCNGELLQASARGEGERIKDLSIYLHGAKEKIDPLFEELVALSEELDERSREFDRKLEEICPQAEP